MPETISKNHLAHCARLPFGTVLEECNAGGAQVFDEYSGRVGTGYHC